MDVDWVSNDDTNKHSNRFNDKENIFAEENSILSICNKDMNLKYKRAVAFHGFSQHYYACLQTQKSR